MSFQEDEEVEGGVDACKKMTPHNKQTNTERREAIFKTKTNVKEEEGRNEDAHGGSSDQVRDANDAPERRQVVEVDRK